MASDATSGFDTLAHAYDRYRIGYATELYDVLAEFGLAAGSAVLDVGSGTGLVAAELVSRGIRVTGIDISEPMLACARARVPAADFMRADAEALPFGADSFDAAVSAQTFHWLDRTKALAEIVRVVRPGGTIAIWWKALLRGDGIRLVRKEVARAVGLAEPKALLSEHFDAFGESALVDQRLRIIPWIVEMSVADYLGYERSRARANDAYGSRLPDYLSALEARLGPPESKLTLSYLHLLYLGRAPERAP